MDRLVILKFVQPFLQPVAVSTSTEYEKAWLRLDGRHWGDYAQTQRLGKRAASVLRAAWRRGMARKIQDEVESFALLELTGDQSLLALSAQAINCKLQALQADLELPAYQPPEGTVRAGKNSKRKSLKGLPPDWRDIMLENAKAEDQMPLLVLALSGCRPAELKMGVHILVDDDWLAFIIQGAKVKEHAGFEQRSVVIQPHTLLQRNHELIEQMRGRDGQTVAIADGQSFQKRIQRLALRLGFKRVSCYSFRHQLGSDIKASGTGRTNLAKVLGHQSEATQTHYGGYQQGNRGGITPDVHGYTETEPRPRLEPDFFSKTVVMETAEHTTRKSNNRTPGMD